MNRPRAKTFAPRSVTIKLWTLKDKGIPMFRVPDPEQHIVEVSVGSVIVREWTFVNRKEAVQHYERLFTLLK